eukprot:SAG31_NODE_523_length_14545_cov_4.805067_18_plen_99_part_00
MKIKSRFNAGSTSGSERCIKIGENEPLQIAFEHVARANDAQIDVLRFVFDGQRVQGDQTTEQVFDDDSDDNDDDGDEENCLKIDVFVEQIGGSYMEDC